MKKGFTMRKDIKFRGICKADKKWIYGDLRLGGIYKNNPAIIDHRLNDADSDADISLSPEVYPETICQYTGFKDANGTEVYEHDILKYGYLWLEVVYDNKIGCYYPVIRRLDGTVERCTFTIGALFNGNNDVVVIGNRFNNPEPTPPRSTNVERAFTADDIQIAMTHLGFDKDQIHNLILHLTRHDTYSGNSL